MHLIIALCCCFLLVPVKGDIWINYLLGLTSNYLHTATHGVSNKQAYEVARPVVQRAKEHCVTGHTSDIHPVIIKEKQTLLKPCGFLSNQQPRLSTINTYTKQYKLVIKSLADFHFNVSFRHITLLFSLDECMVESINLIDPDNKRSLRFCGKLTPGDVQLKTNAFELVFRKHIWSNSSFFLFYHVIDNYAKHTHSSKFYPIHPLLDMYSREVDILEDYISCHHCYSTIIYIKLMLKDALKLTEGSHDPCCLHNLHDGPTRQYPKLIPNINIHNRKWVYPTSSGPALTNLASVKLNQPGCATKRCLAAWEFTVVRRDMETLYLEPNMTARFSFPRQRCFYREHYISCSVRIGSLSSQHFPHISVTSLNLEQGFNTHTCDHAAVIFATEKKMVTNRVHSSAMLCHQYLTMENGLWTQKLPFDEYTGGNHVIMGNYIEISYFSYILPWQFVSHFHTHNHIKFEASLTTCYGLGLNCYIPQRSLSGSRIVSYGRVDTDNLIPILPKAALEVDYLYYPYLKHSDGKNDMHLQTNTLDSYRYMSLDGTAMTNVYLKRGKVCVTIQKYPRLVPGTQRRCGYTLLRDIDSSIKYISKNIVKHKGQTCITSNTDTKTVKVLRFRNSYRLLDVNSFVVGGHCVFKHTLSTMGYTNNLLTENTAPFIGSYWLQSLNHIFSSKDGFQNGTSVVAHYTIPALLTTAAFTNMDRSVKTRGRQSKYKSCT